MLGEISWSHLTPQSKQDQHRGGYLGPCSVELWVYPWMEIPQAVWAACSNVWLVSWGKKKYSWGLIRMSLVATCVYGLLSFHHVLRKVCLLPYNLLLCKDTSNIPPKNPLRTEQTQLYLCYSSYVMSWQIWRMKKTGARLNLKMTVVWCYSKLEL